MEYNTQREKLVFPEYGRHIHKLVNLCVDIPEKEERTRAAYAIVAVMGSMHPHLRDVPEFKHKLWNHLAIMSDFKMDIEWPYPMVKQEELDEKPDKVDYSVIKMRYKHYGYNIEQMLNMINGLETEEERDALTSLLANHMKKLVVTWKKEHVDDEVIFKDIRRMTNNTVLLKDDLVLNSGWDMNVNLHSSSRAPKKKRSNRKRNN